MEHRDYHIGPGAVSLLLVIVVVGMSILGLLAMISARGDFKLTERSIGFVVSEYAAAAEAEARLAELDGILSEASVSASDDEYLKLVSEMLPEGMTLEERTVSWCVESDGGRDLVCEVEILPLGADERYRWVSHIFEAASNDAF